MNRPPDPRSVMLDVPVEADDWTVAGVDADGLPVVRFDTEPDLSVTARFWQAMADRRPDPGLACPYVTCGWYVRGRDAEAVADYEGHALDVHAMVSQ